MDRTTVGRAMQHRTRNAQRRPISRRRGNTLGFISLLLVGGLFTGDGVPTADAAQPIKGATFLISARYEGRYHQETTRLLGSSHIDYHWDEKVTAWVSGDTAEVLSKTVSLSADGNYHVDGYTPPGVGTYQPPAVAPIDCQFSAPVPAEVKRPINFLVNVQDGRVTAFQANVTLPDAIGSCASPANFAGNDCTNRGYTAAQASTFCEEFLAWAPVMKFDGPTVVVPIDHDQPGAEGLETSKRSVHATITLTREGAAPAGPRTPPPARDTPQSVRDAALADMKTEWTKMAYPCFVAGVGAATLIVPGPAGIYAGGTMLVVAVPYCAKSIKIIQDLNLTYNDPPVGNFTVVASVPKTAAPPVAMPACPTGPPSALASCTELQAAALDYLDKLQGVSDVASTLATTIGRESAAGAAGDANAVALQQQAGLALLPQLGAADAARATAGARLATALRALGARARLTKPQAVKATALVLKQLSAAGVSEKEIRDALGNTLKSAPLDFLATLR